MLRTEPKHKEPPGRDSKRQEHGWQSVLGFGDPAAPVLGAGLESGVGQKVSVRISNGGADQTPDVDEPGIALPEIGRHRNKLWADDGHGDDATDKAGVVQHNHPGARQR